MTPYPPSRQHIIDDGQLFAFVPWNQVGIAHGHVDVGVTHEIFQFDQRDLAGLSQP